MTQAAATRLRCAQGSFELLRYPRRNQEPLQAWCAADELLLQACAERYLKAEQQTLVVNDDHGALCVALQPATLWTDSALAAHAASQNLQRNQRQNPTLTWSVDPPAPHSLAVVRIPKQIPYFEYQLALLAKVMPEGSTLLAAGMDKHLSPQTADVITRYFGQTTRHKGQRKARLFSATRNNAPAPPELPPSEYFCAQLGSELQSLPNVFSREKLDIGSRFLLENLDTLTPVETALDLACGNGVLGLAALQRGLCRKLTLCDESAMAIASARRNAHAIATSVQSVDFHHGDGLLNLQETAELILCNPPFHLGHTVDDFAGRRLLAQCAEHLTPDGQLILVANRHLEYRVTLQRHFRRVEIFAQNGKFTLWRARSG